MFERLTLHAEAFDRTHAKDDIGIILQFIPELLKINLLMFDC